MYKWQPPPVWTSRRCEGTSRLPARLDGAAASRRKRHRFLTRPPQVRGGWVGGGGWGGGGLPPSWKQLCCAGSVNRVNVTHSAEDGTSNPACFAGGAGEVLRCGWSGWGRGGDMVSLINLDLVMAVWSVKRMSSGADGEDKEMSPDMDWGCTSTFVLRLMAAQCERFPVFVPGIGLLYHIWAPKRKGDESRPPGFPL